MTNRTAQKEAMGSAAAAERVAGRDHEALPGRGGADHGSERGAPPPPPQLARLSMAEEAVDPLEPAMSSSFSAFSQVCPFWFFV